MEEIEYLEEYEDLILPTIHSNSREVDGFQVSQNSNMMQDEDSSSIDQDIFESLFDDHSDDESSNILQKKSNPKFSQRGTDERASLDSLDMLVKDLVGDQNSLKKSSSASSQTIKTNANPSILNPKAPSLLQKKMSAITPSSSVIARSTPKGGSSHQSPSLLLNKGRPSGSSLAKLPISRSSIGFQKRPVSSASTDTSSALSSSSQKPKASMQGSRIDLQHKFDKSKSVATVRPTVQQKQLHNQNQQRRLTPGAPNRNLPSTSGTRSGSGLVTLSARKNMSLPSNRGGPRGGPTTRGGMAARQLQRPQTTIIKPERRETKDPSEDPLSLDDIAEALLDSDSDSFSLSDISDETLDSMSDLDEDSNNGMDISNDSTLATKRKRKTLENNRGETSSPAVSDDYKNDESISQMPGRSKPNISKTVGNKESSEGSLTNDNGVISKKPAAEKVTILSDTLLTRIDSALLDKAVMDKKSQSENEYSNQTNEDVVAALERELMPFLKKKDIAEGAKQDVVEGETEESNLPADKTESRNLLDELADAVFGVDKDLVEGKSDENIEKQDLQMNPTDIIFEADNDFNLTTNPETRDLITDNSEQISGNQSIQSNTAEVSQGLTSIDDDDIIEETQVEYEEFNDQLDNEVAMEVEVETVKEVDLENDERNVEILNVNRTQEDESLSAQQSSTEDANDAETDPNIDEQLPEFSEQQTTETSENIVIEESLKIIKEAKKDENPSSSTTSSIEKLEEEKVASTTTSVEKLGDGKMLPSTSSVEKLDEETTPLKNAKKENEKEEDLKKENEKKEDSKKVEEKKDDEKILEITSTNEKLEEKKNQPTRAAPEKLKEAIENSDKEKEKMVEVEKELSVKKQTGKRKRCSTPDSSSSEKSLESVKKVFKAPVNPTSNNLGHFPAKEKSSSPSPITFRKRALRSPALSDKSREASPAPPSKKYRLDADSASGRSSRSTSESDWESNESSASKNKTNTKSDITANKLGKNTDVNRSQDLKLTKTKEHEAKNKETKSDEALQQEKKDNIDSESRSKSKSSSREELNKMDYTTDSEKNRVAVVHKRAKDKSEEHDNNSTPSKHVGNKEVSSSNSKLLVPNESKVEEIKKSIVENTAAEEKDETQNRTPKKLKVMMSKQSLGSVTKVNSAHPTTKDNSAKSTSKAEPTESIKVTTMKPAIKETTTKPTPMDKPSDSVMKDKSAASSTKKAGATEDNARKQSGESSKETKVPKQTEPSNESLKTDDDKKRSDKNGSQDSLQSIKKITLKRWKVSSDKDMDKTRKDSEKSSSSERADAHQTPKVSANTSTANQTLTSKTISTTQKESISNKESKEEKERENKVETPMKKMTSKTTRVDVESKPTDEQHTIKVKEHLGEVQRSDKSYEKKQSDEKQKNIVQKNTAPQKNTESPNTKIVPKKISIDASNKLKTHEKDKEKINVAQNMRKSTLVKSTEDITTTPIIKRKPQHETEVKKITDKMSGNNHGDEGERRHSLAVASSTVKLQTKDNRNSLPSMKVTKSVQELGAKQTDGKKPVTTTATKTVPLKREKSNQQLANKVENIEVKKEPTAVSSEKTNVQSKSTVSAAITNDKNKTTPVIKAFNKSVPGSTLTKQKSSISLKNSSSTQSSKNVDEKETKETATNQMKSETTTLPDGSSKQRGNVAPPTTTTTPKNSHISVAAKKPTIITKRSDGTQLTKTNANTTPKNKQQQEAKPANIIQKKSATTPSEDNDSKATKTEDTKTSVTPAKPNKPILTGSIPSSDQKQLQRTQSSSNLKESKVEITPKAPAVQKKAQVTPQTINKREVKRALPTKEKDDEKVTQNEKEQNKTDSTQNNKTQKQKQTTDIPKKNPEEKQRDTITADNKTIDTSLQGEDQQKLVPTKAAMMDSKMSTKQSDANLKDVKDSELIQTKDSSKSVGMAPKLTNTQQDVITRKTDKDALTTTSTDQICEEKQSCDSEKKLEDQASLKPQKEETKVVEEQQVPAREKEDTKEEPKRAKRDLQEKSGDNQAGTAIEKKSSSESPLLVTRKSLRTKIPSDKESEKTTAEANTTLITSTASATTATSSSTTTSPSHRVEQEKITHSHGTRKALKQRVAETPPPATLSEPISSPQHLHATRKATKAKQVLDHQSSAPITKPTTTESIKNSSSTSSTSPRKELPDESKTKEIESKNLVNKPALTRRSLKSQPVNSVEIKSEVLSSENTQLGKNIEKPRREQTPSLDVKSKSTGSLCFNEWKETKRKEAAQSNSNEEGVPPSKHNKSQSSVDLVIDRDQVNESTKKIVEKADIHLRTAAKKASNESSIEQSTSNEEKYEDKLVIEHISDKRSENKEASMSLTSKLVDVKTSVTEKHGEEQNKNEVDAVSTAMDDTKKVAEDMQRILDNHSNLSTLDAVKAIIGVETKNSEKISIERPNESHVTKEIKSDVATDTIPQEKQVRERKKRPRCEVATLMASLPKSLESSIYEIKRRRRDLNNSLSPVRGSNENPHNTRIRTQLKNPTGQHVTKQVVNPSVSSTVTKSIASAIGVPVTRRMEGRTTSSLNKSYPLKVLDMSPVKHNPFATASVNTTKKAHEPIKMSFPIKLKEDKVREKLRKCRKVRVRINRYLFRKYQNSILTQLKSSIQAGSTPTQKTLSVKSHSQLSASADVPEEEHINNSLSKLCNTLNSLSASGLGNITCSSPPSSATCSQASSRNISKPASIDTIGQNLRLSSSSILSEPVSVGQPNKDPKCNDTRLHEMLTETFQHSNSDTLSAHSETNERISPNNEQLHGDDSLLTPLKSSNQASEMVRQQQQQQQQKRSARLQQQNSLRQQTGSAQQTQHQQQITAKPLASLQQKQHQHEQSIFTPIVPKKEVEEETQSPAVHTTTARSLMSGGIPATVVDNSGTRLYTFLHPSKYNRSHGAVLLDYCCPNLDGPMPAIDPSREHAQLQSLVRELPAYIVMTTKVVTRADLEAKNNSIPASIRKKMEKLTSTSVSSNGRNTTLQALIAKGPQPPAPPKHAIGATAVPTVPTQNPTGSSEYSSTLTALQKQLPATTTLTPKMPPMTLPESLPPLTPFSAFTSAAQGSGAAANVSRGPLKTEFMRAVLRSNLRRFDMILQKCSPRISELNFVDRQRILDGLTQQTTLSAQDVEQATRLLDEYYQLTNSLVPPISAPVSMTNTTTVNATLPTTTSTTPTTYTASPINQNASLTSTQPAGQQLEQLHTNTVQKIRIGGSTTLQAKRQVPIYDKDRNIIGYQMHNVSASAVSSTNSTLSNRVVSTPQTRQRLPNTVATTSTPTSALKQPPQESPRIFYTKPVQASTPIANNNNTSNNSNSSAAAAAYDAASRLGRNVTIRQVASKPSTQLNNSSPRMQSLPKMPTLTPKPNISSAIPRIATITTDNVSASNLVTRANTTLAHSSQAPIIAKRVTRHGNTGSEGQIVVVTKDKDGLVDTGTLSNDAETILPDEECSAAQLREIKREKEDDFIGGS